MLNLERTLGVSSLCCGVILLSILASCTPRILSEAPNGEGGGGAGSSASSPVTSGSASNMSTGSTVDPVIPTSPWTFRFGDVEGQWGGGIATDLAGNVFVTGGFSGKLDLEGTVLQVGVDSTRMFLGKFDPMGKLIWAKSFPAGGFSGGHHLGADADGNVVLLGGFSGWIDLGDGPIPAPESRGALLAKFDSSGNPLWSRVFSNVSSEDGSGLINGLAVAPTGEFAVTGTFRSAVDFGAGTLYPMGHGDVHVTLFEATGVARWSKRFASPKRDDDAVVALTPAGDVVFAATFHGPVDLGGGIQQPGDDWDITVAGLRGTDGGYLWSRKIESTMVPRVAVDPSNNVLLYGTIRGFTLDLGGGPLEGDAFVAKFDPWGNHVWSRANSSPYCYYDGRVAADPQGNTIVAAQCDGPSQFGPGTPAALASGVVAKFDPLGEPVWVHGVSIDDTPSGIVVDAASNVLLTGGVHGKLNFGQGTLEGEPYANWDIFLAKLGP
jgi:hypothetical protein